MTSIPKISKISKTYVYTCPPPFGAGSNARLVLETATRSINYSKKGNDPESIKNGMTKFDQLDRGDTFLPTDEINGKPNLMLSKMMIAHFCKAKRGSINKAIERTFTEIMQTNYNELCKGRQTYEPISAASIPAANALEKTIHFLKENGIPTGPTMINYCNSLMKLFSLEEVKYTRKILVDDNVTIKKLAGRIHLKTTGKKNVIEKEFVLKGKEKDEFIWNCFITLETYRKDEERNKSDRRAIASPSMFLRPFFYVVEKFAHHLSEEIEESTIHLGGLQKQDRIQKMLQRAKSEKNANFSYDSCYYVTGDNSKWNECMSPQLFQLWMQSALSSSIVHEDTDSLRSMKRTLLQLTSVATTVLFDKRLRIPMGVKLSSSFHRVSAQFELEMAYRNGKLNSELHEMTSVLDSYGYLDGNFIKVPPGMVMGMLNKMSTLIGMIAGTFNSDNSMDETLKQLIPKDKWLRRWHYQEDLKKMGGSNIMQAKSFLLQSSDDFVMVIIGQKGFTMEKYYEFFTYCKAMGMNSALSKTHIREQKTKGVMEYTSLFVEDDYITPQIGTHVTSLMPDGLNPPSDLAAKTRQIVQLLMEQNLNYIGAWAALQCLKVNLRRLYRIDYGSQLEYRKSNLHAGEKPNAVPDGYYEKDEISFCIGGNFRFFPSNSHLSEFAILIAEEENESTASGKERRRKHINLMFNPRGITVAPLESRVIYDKTVHEHIDYQHGMPINNFNFKFRTNETLTNKSFSDVRRERAYLAVAGLMSNLLPQIEYTISNSETPIHTVLLNELTRLQVKHRDDEEIMSLVLFIKDEINNIMTDNF